MRLHGLDIARFLAFCGMVLVNFRIAAQVTPGNDFASVLTNSLEGRASALFVILAGIGLSLGHAKAGKSSKLVLLARAGFLLAIGLVNLLIFEADILHYYALYFLVALPFVSAPDRSLWIAALGAVALGFLGLIFLDYEAHWNWETLAYADFWTLEGFLRHSFFNGWHPVFPWVAFVFFGMWIGRQDLYQKTIQNRLILWGLIAGALGSVPGHLVQDPDLASLLGTASLPPGPFYILTAGGSALVMIGAMLRLGAGLHRLGIAEWLAAPGRMALSLYVAHILLGMGTLEAMGQLDGSLTTEQIFGFSLGFCALSMLLTWIWMLISPHGPLESLMRRCTEIFR
ncbi:DUF418 domain-containing protein [Pseudophaeobacter sp.]|uniref:DUF418 domain-containing protein n=1 Tax=Pseudophaeobacter sp. TaxID=1971739 RepID=UPI0032975787